MNINKIYVIVYAQYFLEFITRLVYMWGLNADNRTNRWFYLLGIIFIHVMHYNLDQKVLNSGLQGPLFTASLSSKPIQTHLNK